MPRDIADYYGRTPLHMAAFFGKKDTIESLLKDGADIFARDEIGRTPLHFACYGYGNLESVKSLIDNGATLTTKDRKCKTILHFAANSGSPEILELLLSRKIIRSLINEMDANGQTPLHAACMTGCSKATNEGRLKIVKMLLEQGAVATLCDKQGMIPYEIAVEHGFEDIAKLLEGHLGHETKEEHDFEKIATLIKENLGLGEDEKEPSSPSARGHTPLFELEKKKSQKGPELSTERDVAERNAAAAPSGGIDETDKNKSVLPEHSYFG